ncbi:MAG TPA: sulfite exporter TauE/SafE family protein [Actinomycetota bacterium]|nr:sulfite exporter TauE/SafE family protein [Actinomycetota bacterium]
MDLTAPEMAIALISVLVGGLIQGSIGFGMALIVTPVLSFVAPGSVPATILILAFPLTLSMAVREREAIEKRGLLEITLGRLPGTALAVVLIGVLSGERIIFVIGAVVFVAALISWFTPEFELKTRLRVVAGVFSGFMGTIAGIGGPALALAYQRRPGPQLRATLAAAFVIGSIISLTVLGVAGRVQTQHLILALQLIPALLIGLWLSARLARVLDRGWLRPAVLGFALVSGLAAMWKGLG